VLLDPADTESGCLGITQASSTSRSPRVLTIGVAWWRPAAHSIPSVAGAGDPDESGKGAHADRRDETGRGRPAVLDPVFCDSYTLDRTQAESRDRDGCS
jgi:hypothetical protein